MSSLKRSCCKLRAGWFRPFLLVSLVPLSLAPSAVAGGADAVVSGLSDQVTTGAGQFRDVAVPLIAALVVLGLTVWIAGAILGLINNRNSD